MYESHAGLSNKYEVSCAELDFLVDYLRNNQEVLGSRMMGGGFGGCTINLVKTDAILEIKQKVAKAYKEAFQLSSEFYDLSITCLLYTSPSPRDATLSRMPSSA